MSNSLKKKQNPGRVMCGHNKRKPAICCCARELNTSPMATRDPVTSPQSSLYVVSFPTFGQRQKQRSVFEYQLCVSYPGDLETTHRHVSPVTDAGSHLRLSFNNNANVNHNLRIICLDFFCSLIQKKGPCVALYCVKICA